MKFALKICPKIGMDKWVVLVMIWVGKCVGFLYDLNLKKRPNRVCLVGLPAHLHVAHFNILFF